MKVINIGYIGYSINAIESIYHSGFFNLKVLFVPENRITCLIRLFADSNSISLYIIKDSSDLKKKIKLEINNIDCCFMYDCGIIIKKETIDIIDVYNLHPGSLIKNRGNNPFEYAILTREKDLEISLYKINEKIDLGELINTIKIPLSIKDNLLDIERKVYSVLPNILCILYDFLIGKITTVIKINDGIYNPKINESIVKINILNDSPVDIYNKIRASGYIYKKEDIEISDIKPISEQLKPWYNKGAIISLKEGEFNITYLERIEFFEKYLLVSKYEIIDNTLLLYKNGYVFTLKIKSLAN